MLRIFGGPVVVSVLALGALYLWGGGAALVLAILLSILEISLSFDNAVINAKILERMSPQWQRRFLTWGMLVAVLGARLILPAVLISAAAGISPVAAMLLALRDPVGYGEALAGALPLIHAFGGAFLLMVSLRYFFDEAKSVHWIHFLERRLAAWGRVEAIEVGLALCVLLFCAAFSVAPAMILGAGCVGIVLFVIIGGITGALGAEAQGALESGMMLFVYLNLLDAAFSLDGVVGAFALTVFLPVIIVGLGIGAYFVRAFTILFVERHTLSTLVYLEHGAYWAIFGLAFTMFAALFTPVPEFIPAFVGVIFIGSAYLSSVRVRSVV